MVMQELLGCEPGKCTSPKDWYFARMTDFLASPVMVSGIRPDILILNTGLHGPLKKPGALEGIIRAAKVAVSETQGQVYWKTITTRYTAGPAFPPPSWCGSTN